MYSAKHSMHYFSYLATHLIFGEGVGTQVGQQNKSPIRFVLYTEQSHLSICNSYDGFPK